MWIDVKMPYEPGFCLGRAYNRAMETAGSEWVLLLDTDVFLLNPRWYEMCVKAIKKVGIGGDADAGWITCYTNRIGGNYQRWETGVSNSDDIWMHMEVARDVWLKHGDLVEEIKGALSGHFILTSKTAWRKAGKFTESRDGQSIYGVDNDYSRAVKQARYKCYIMRGLYVYHLYKKKRLMDWGRDGTGQRRATG